jgi:rare lipoprotein A
MTIKIIKKITTYITIHMLISSHLFGATTGVASVYGNNSDRLLGKLTASGERLTSKLFTVASKTFPFGTLLKIINIKTGDCVIAKVNDRGPYVRGRVLDLNMAVAKALKIKYIGIVKYEKTEETN